jgi:hypothetical protein
MSKICEVDDCNNNAFYGSINDYIKKYCKDHKNIEDNLIDIRNKNKYCKSCLYSRGCFGYINDKKNLFCVNCKLDDMIDIKNSKCLFENCIKQPYFNFEGETNGIYCGDHKKPNMIDVITKKCITVLCDKCQVIDQYCCRCFYYLFPNDNRCKYIKLKENEVKKFIQENFKDLLFIFDEPIKGDGMCINKRPDILLNLNHHSIIIEIDENQHKYYNIECDNSRPFIIQEALNRPTIFIRFNPDDYVDENNKKILSPFKIDKKLGLTTIPEENENDWNNRLLKLKETIKNNLEYKSEEPIIIIKLFYDK